MNMGEVDSARLEAAVSELVMLSLAELEDALKHVAHGLYDRGVCARVVEQCPDALETVVIAGERQTGLAIHDPSGRLVVQVAAPSRSISIADFHARQGGAGAVETVI